MTVKYGFSENERKTYADYFKKSAVVLRVMRYAVLIGFVVFCIFCIGFFKENITVDNMRYLMKYINLSVHDTTPSETSVSIRAKDGDYFFLLGSDLAVVSTDGTTLYDFAGNKLYRYHDLCASPAACSNGKNILVYDTQGTGISLFSPVSKVLDKQLDYPVKSAFLSDSGYFAVVTAEETYRSGIVVYDPDGKETFRWMSADKYVMGAAINQSATMIACAAVYNQNGSFYTDLVRYQIAFDYKTQTWVLKDTKTVTLEDTFAVKIGYDEDSSHLFLLTDKDFLLFDTDLQALSKTGYRIGNAKFFKQTDEGFLLAESHNLSGNSMSIKAIDYEGKPLFECSLGNKIVDATLSHHMLYVLMRDSLLVYDYSNEEKGAVLVAKKDLDIQYKAVLVDEYDRFVLVGLGHADRFSLDALLKEELGL